MFTVEHPMSDPYGTRLWSEHKKFKQSENKKTSFKS